MKHIDKKFNYCYNIKMIRYENATLATLAAQMPPDDRSRVIETSWKTRDLGYVATVLDSLEVVPATPNSSSAYIFNPEGEIDESQTIVLTQAHTSGITEAQIVRAAMTQEYVAPHSRLVLLPTNIMGQKHSNLAALSTEDKFKMKHGNMGPYAELQLNALGNVPYDLGRLSLSGYSMGGRNVLSMTANNNDRFDIVGVNADDLPSQPGRTARGVMTGFVASANAGDLKQAIAHANIRSLHEANSPLRANIGLAKFLMKQLARDSVLQIRAMSGSAAADISAAMIGRDVKVSSIDGSAMFDPQTIDEVVDGNGTLRVVSYSGEGFNRHATGDNVTVHALMVKHGLLGSMNR